MGLRAATVRAGTEAKLVQGHAWHKSWRMEVVRKKGTKHVLAGQEDRKSLLATCTVVCDGILREGMRPRSTVITSGLVYQHQGPETDEGVPT